MTRLARAALVATALALAACRPAALMPPPVRAADVQAYALSGTVSFEDRKTQIAPTTLTSLATVTLLNASNQTVATARTSTAGAFSVLPGAGFTVTVGDLFYLDAYKGTQDNRVGGNVARLRTILQWTATGWNSTSGTTVVLNPLTTAVAAISGLAPGSVAPAATLGTVAGSNVTSGNATLASNWSAVNALVRDLLAKDQDPLARLALVGGKYVALPDKAQPFILENFGTGTLTDTKVNATGQLVLAGPRPDPGDPFSELDYFAAANVAPETAGSVVSDGTYLYVTNWNNYGNASTERHVVKRIGSGYNGTVRGAYYGTVGKVGDNLGIAYVDGKIYAPMFGSPSKLYQLTVSTGATASIDLPTPLVSRQTGVLAGENYRIITSDGRYFYNLAYGIGGATSYNGFTVQVLDPRQGFKQVRFFTMDTTSYYCDGVYCDGTYLYPIEWKVGNNVSRMRRYRLSDGGFETEWTFTQGSYVGNYQPDEYNPISGAWDPVNKVFWIGNLGNEKITLMRGGNYIPSGTWQSAALDTAVATPHYGRMSWANQADTGEVTFQVRSADTLGALGSATWYGPSSTTDAYTVSGTALNPVHAKNRYLQIRATLRSSLNQLDTPMLNRVSVEVLP